MKLFWNKGVREEVVEGWRVRFAELGAGKRPVLLIHGLGGSLESWRYNLTPLSKHLKVVALDLPGFGLSEKREADYTPEFYADFTASFIKTICSGRASLVGHSMGGLIALVTALRHPEVVERLVVVDAVVDARASKLIKEMMGEWWDREKLIKYYERFAGGVDEEVLELRLKLYEDELSRRAYLSALRALENPPPIERFSRISKPTLIIWGGRDEVTRLGGGLRLNSLIKNSRLVVFEESFHSPHAEEAEKFNKLLLEFLMEGGGV